MYYGSCSKTYPGKCIALFQGIVQNQKWNGMGYSRTSMARTCLGWLVGCFGFNGPLRQYFSLYRAVSQREGERGKKGKMKVKISKQPPPAPTASAVGPCPTVIQTVGRPGTGSSPSTIAPPDHPQHAWDHENKFQAKVGQANQS